jgi:uncharacterized protein (DUF736 family)
MAYEPREGSGVLFKNQDKKADNHPDYRGDIMVAGKVFELAAWIKEGKKGKFMSLSAKPKEQRPRKDEETPF